jgi:nitrate reductase NapE component
VRKDKKNPSSSFKRLPASHICIGKRKEKNNKIIYITPVFGVWVLLTLSFVVSFGVWTLEFVMGFPAEAISYKILRFRAGQNKQRNS